VNAGHSVGRSARRKGAEWHCCGSDRLDDAIAAGAPLTRRGVEVPAVKATGHAGVNQETQRQEE